jgi:PAS domain S-box-containing protein
VTLVKTYGIALVAVAAAVALRWVLDPVLGDTLPLVTLFAAVALVVWIGGYGPAILAAVVGYLACNYLFIEPRGVSSIVGTQQFVGLLAYLFTCTIIIWLGQAARMAQTRAQERGETLSVTLQSIGDAVMTTDLEGRITSMNEVASALTGWSQSEASGRHLNDVFRIINEDTREPVANPVARALREGLVVGLANHTLLLDKSGAERPIDDSAAPIRDESGRVSGCVLIFRDVTQQRRQERETSRQLTAARLLASIVESSDDVIISKSLDGKIQSWNAAAERLFGYRADEAIGRHISLIIPEDRIFEEDQIIASLKEGRRVDHFETERVHRDGKRIFVSLTVSPIRDQAGVVVGASKIVRDITERKRAELERQNFVTLIENSRDFIGMSDLDGVPFFINRAGLEMVGLASLEEARHVRVLDFFFPEDQARIVEEFFPKVLRDGHGEIEVRFRHFRTGAARWMAYEVVTLPDAAGRPIGFATVSQDVTERRRFAEDLREADRRKGEFMATLAHELRNPLAPVRNSLHLVRNSPDGDVRANALSVMERQLGHLVRLVDDLLDVSRITTGKLELRTDRVDLTDILRHAVETAHPEINRKEHRLTVEVPAGGLPIDGDAMRLTQVFANLMHNASKFTDRGGHLTLKATRTGSDAEISVRDTGEGIAHDMLSPIFEMFAQADRSLERRHGGLGIGLTMARRLVELHGGTIMARSDGIGQGSEFIVRLPLATRTETQEPRESSGKWPALESRRILVADDNPDSLDSLAMLLRLRGNEVRTAPDGERALAEAESYRPEVILLDIGMPVVNGYEACRRIRDQDWGRNVLIIALTGWGQEEDRERSRAAGFDHHMVKPVDPEALMKQLAKHAATRDARRAVPSA